MVNWKMNEDTQTALGSAPVGAGIENHRAKLIEGDRNAMQYVLRYLQHDPAAANYHTVHGGISGPEAIAMLEAALLQHPDRERTAA